MGRRAIILLGVGLGLGLSGAAAAWWYDREERTFFTDGGTIRERASASPVRDVLWTPPALLALNTGDDEYEPRVSGDGQTLFFVRGRAGRNADLYTAHRTADGWSDPEPLRAINTGDDELGPQPSPDGRLLYLASNRPGGAGGYDLWVSRIGAEGWGAPENLGAVNTAENEYNPAVTPDGLTLYFASNRPRPGENAGDGAASWGATVRENIAGHDFDLYRAPLDQGVPGAPEAVDALNSAANEGSPAFSPAGDFVCFASDRPGGLGGFDLYRARLDGGRPTHAENLRSPVNSEANELDPTLGTGGFGLDFSSDRVVAERESATGAARDYNLYGSVSREVYRVTEPATGARWAAMLQQGLPWLLWFLLTLLTVLLILLLWRAQRNKHLSLLTRCLIGSMLVHLIILFLLSLWGVTNSLGQLFHKPGGTRVRLASTGVGDALAVQVRGTAPMLPAMITNPPPADAPVTTAAARMEPVNTSADRSSPSLAMLSSPAAASESPAPTSVPDARAENAPETAVLTANVALPDVGTGLNSAEPAPTVTFNSPTAPEPRPGASAAPAQSIAVPSTTPAPPRTSLTVNSTTDDAASPPGAIPGRAAASLELAAAPASGSASDLATPRESAAAPAKEPEMRAAMAPPTSLEPAALSVGSGEAPANAGQPAVGRSAPATGATLAVNRTTDLAAPSSSPSRAADLVSAERAFDVAVPSDAAPAREASITGEAGEGAASPAAPGALDPGLSMSSAGTPTGSPAAARSAVAPGASLADHDSAAPLAADRLPAPPVAASMALMPVGDAAADLALPQEVALPEDPFAQREPGHRLDLVERLGGSAETEAAVARSLAWLAAHQSEDGRWASGHFDDGCRRCGGTTKIDSDRAVTGLALLCFMASDHTHTRDGPYRESVARSLAWLRDQQKPNGDLRGEETMYSHGIATIALAEAYAMTKDPDLAGPVERAVAFIAGARNTSDGGWRYEPGDPGDTSVLGWQAMALTSAQRAGLAAADDALKAADRWLDEVSERSPGLYAYQPGMPPTQAMTAEGLYVRQLLGHGRDEEIMRTSVERVMRSPPKWTEQPSTYAWYYATLALFQNGGPEWERWNGLITTELLANQRADGAAAGSWDPVDRWAVIGGRVYQTTICTLTLEVYYRYLPMYAADGGGAAPGTGGGPRPSP